MFIQFSFILFCVFPSFLFLLLPPLLFSSFMVFKIVYESPSSSPYFWCLFLYFLSFPLPLYMLFLSPFFPFVLFVLIVFLNRTKTSYSFLLSVSHVLISILSSIRFAFLHPFPLHFFPFVLVVHPFFSNRTQSIYSSFLLSLPQVFIFSFLLASP